MYSPATCVLYRPPVEIILAETFVDDCGNISDVGRKTHETKIAVPWTSAWNLMVRVGDRHSLISTRFTAWQRSCSGLTALRWRHVRVVDGMYVRPDVILACQ